MAKSKKEIIQTLATKYNLPLKVVTNIINHQFKFVNKIIAKGEFEGVRLPYFGKFDVNKKRLKYIKEKSGSTNNK